MRSIRTQVPLAFAAAMAITVVMVMVVSCGEEKPPANQEPTTTETEEVEYKGETSGGAIPQFPAGTIESDDAIDLGTISPDDTCCTLSFSIADEESLDATGLLRGDNSVFGQGVELIRNAGFWSAEVCFPINSSSNYYYEFTWVAGQISGGIVEDDEGNQEEVFYDDFQSSVRADDVNSSFTQADGNTVNYLETLSTCD